MMMTDGAVGFTADEVATSESTRSARLKWVIVVDETIAPGLQVNAAVCVAAATAAGVTNLLAGDVTDADGARHPGLPWAGCSILVASPDQLVALRVKVDATEGLFVADMPAAAQETRVYDEFAERIAETPTSEVRALAMSVVGPRRDVDRLVRRLSLMA